MRTLDRAKPVIPITTWGRRAVSSYRPTDALVATKFHVPRAGWVPRPRLLAGLAQGIGRGLTVACTPAGFGKTTLLGDWARRSRRPVAWLSLDTADNDPARFWRYVAAALERVRPGAAAPVEALLSGPQRPPLEAVATAVINQLAVVPDAGAVVLVLDDYHLIEAPTVHDSVAFLVERLPPALRLVLASRTDPPLPLARLRARGQLGELRADPAGFVATFSGSHRFVLDYLSEEVLARQPSEVVDFLLETSVLDRLSGPLCDAVTGRCGSQAVLEGLERASLFVVPLDEERGWWRYHHLFAGLLRARLAHERPGRVPGLHRAAAAWHEDHGLADGAIRHALAAGEARWAARLIERHAEEMLWRGEGATLCRWFRALPAEMLRARPRLCLAQTITAVFGGQLEAAETLLAGAERAFASVGDEPYQPSVGRASSVLANVAATIALLRAHLAGLNGDADRAALFARQPRTQLGEDELLLGSFVGWNLAVADWLGGRLKEAEYALAELVADRRAVGERYFTVRCCYDLGQVQQARGHLGAALRTYGQGLDIAGETGRQLPIVGIAHVGLAEVLCERNELEAAIDHATQGIALCRQIAYTRPLATGLATLAWIRQAQGDAAGALDAISQAELVQPSPKVVTLFNPVPVWRARLLLAHGEVTAAARWAEERGLRAGDEPSWPREGEYLVLARALAWDEGYVRVIVDEGTPMACLVGRLAAAQRTREAALPASVPPPYLHRLARAFEAGRARTAPRPARGTAAVAGLVEALSTRELQVLRLLASGRSNQQIADELVVVLETVKKHVGHILVKLSAANRTQAVARARALGLLH